MLGKKFSFVFNSRYGPKLVALPSRSGPKRLFIRVRIEPPKTPNLQLQNERETVPGIPDKVACRGSGRRSGD